MARSRLYEESFLERLKDPQEAAAYLDAALEERDQEVFLLALRDVAKARLVSIDDLAQRAGLHQQSLYRALVKIWVNHEFNLLKSRSLGPKCSDSKTTS